MLAIYKREIRSLFTSVIGYITLAVILLYFGFIYSVYNILNSRIGSLEVTFGNSTLGLLLLMLCFSILTMHAFSEEKKSKTDQLLLTSPIKIKDIVLGKYFAIVTVYAVTIAVMLVYFFILGFFGKIYISESLIITLGYFLYGCMCLAIGLLISTLVENTIACTILSFFAMFITFIASVLINAVEGKVKFLARILSCFDGLTRLSEFFSGNLSISAIVYYISFIALMLFLATQVIQKRRYTVSARNLTFGAYSLTSIVIAVVVVLLLNIGVSKIPDVYRTFDLSTNQTFKLATETKDLLKNLDQDVHMVVLEASEEAYDGIVVEFLKQYEQNEHITVEYVDPIINPKFYKQYTDTAPEKGSIIVYNDSKPQVINYTNMFTVEGHFNAETYRYEQTVTGYDIEGCLTSAIQYILSDKVNKAYVLTGHGEGELSSYFEGALTKSCFDVSTINLIATETIPEDADLLIINSAMVDYSEDDARKVIDYIHKGGNIIMAMAPIADETPNIDSILAEYGSTVKNCLVLDNDEAHYNGMLSQEGMPEEYKKLYLLPDLTYEDATEGMKNLHVFLADCTPISTVNLPNVEHIALVTTSNNAYTVDVMNDTTRNSLAQQDGDNYGAFALAMKADLSLDSGAHSILYLVTSPSLLLDVYDGLVSGGNYKLFASMISKLTGYSSSIPVKSVAMEYLVVDARLPFVFLLVTAVIIPVAIFVTGIVIYVKRKRR